MDDIALFTENHSRHSSQSPLADRMRPRTLDDVIGQEHIVGPGRLLRRAIQADRLSSVIFYGPPGTGKTSLARVIANTTKSYFESLNAVLSGIKDIRDAIDRSTERAKLYGRRTILFVDEVHRWNKAQQDALLPWVENGTVILIGATTENPFFEVNRALVSRSRIFQLKSLDADSIRAAALRAIADVERGYGKWTLRFEDGALEHLAAVSGGDARCLLNALELAVETSGWHNPADGERGTRWPPPDGSEIQVSFEAAEESIQRRAVLYDRDGDYHFDTISAFIKSVRGSDPDAALYWLAKMVRAGEDPSFIFRRMIILASEDIGLADPRALSVVISCAEAFERIGFPEGNYPLAHACLYLATAPKSNSVMAFFDALAEVDKEDAEVPNHLKDPSRDKEGFGHGEGYVYPHAYREHWRAQQYLPAVLQGKCFYVPGELGYEKTVRSDVLRKREIQAALLMECTAAQSEKTGGSGDELLHWSPSAKGREHWYKRLESGRETALLAARDILFEHGAPGGAARIFIPRADDGLLLWESLRRAPHGLSAATTGSVQAREALLRFARSGGFEDIELPKIVVAKDGRFIPGPEDAGEDFACAAFDLVILREPLRRFGPAPSPSQDARAALTRLGSACRRIMAEGGRALFLVSPPKLGMRLSQVLRAAPLYESAPAALRESVTRLREAEDAFLARPENAGPDEADARAALSEAGFQVETSVIAQREKRLLLARDIERWFDGAHTGYGTFMANTLNTEDITRVKEALAWVCGQGAVDWRWESLLVKAGPPLDKNSAALSPKTRNPKSEI
ncbi:MAG: AAA family ATPase [Spirochaetaceae bacterium]|jgi:putative ATPase|nr:AAA family ATPase [Spirochaetaceae bacterium]